MHFIRLRLHRLSWIAVVAIFGLVGARHGLHASPQVSDQVAGWAEICTSQGAPIVALDGTVDRDGVPAKPLSSQPHCPYCAQPTPGLGMPPALAAAPLAPAASRHVPLERFSVAAAHTWRSAAQPRAPPAAG
jgi:hypothetical protein